ncbi:phosphoesterase [Luteimonas sp. MJ174]|uniref:phosphoesterase n=1 Tax=Luteimonas sp. MJ174 TaxID=3129237 RepID=UPI0031BA8049
MGQRSFMRPSERFDSQASRTIVARAVSIAGHPAIVVPATITLAAARRDATPAAVGVILFAALAVAVGALVYSFAQVRSGKWAHIDASVPSERSQLNPLLAIALMIAAMALLAAGQDAQVSTGFAMAAAMVGACHLLRAWFKASLHVGFIVFSAFLAWPLAWVAGALLALAAIVSWSRLALHRHTVRDVVAGAALGAAAGTGFLIFGVRNAILHT